MESKFNLNMAPSFLFYFVEYKKGWGEWMRNRVES